MSKLHADFVAHSRDGKAVRQVRAFERNLLLTVLLFAAAFWATVVRVYMSRLTLDKGFVHGMTIVILVAAVLFLLMAVVLVWSRRMMSTYLKVGSILAVDKSTRRAYAAIVKETNTNWSVDALFNRQQAMNMARSAQDALYREEWKRTAPTADKPVGDKKVGA